MLQLTLRNLNANKIRLGLTTFAVVLGVSFVVSSLVLSDGLRNSFGSLSEEIIGGTDLEVSSDSEFGRPQPLDDSIVQTVGDVDGVESAIGFVTMDNIQPIKADGTAVSTVGPPIIGMSWVDDPALSSFTIVEGRAPADGNEFSLDETAAAANGFEVGQTYDVSTPVGTEPFTLVGISRFGDSNETLGAVLSQYPFETAQRVFDLDGEVDSVLVDYASGADPATVQSAVEAVLPDGAKATDQTELLDQSKADFNEGINIFNNILLGFAGVSLFVSIFIISNTFAIVLGQRTKELALLRAVGASPRQVRRSTMGEALVIGLLASILGIAGGVGLNYGLRALFDAIGAGLPPSDLILAPRTIIVAFVVGVGVTILSAFGPARKAATVPPIAAMQDSADTPKQSDRKRNLVGLAMLNLGIGIGAFGLFGSIDGVALRVTALGVGAALSFLGVSLASPAAARPLLGGLGVPLRPLGAAGELSTQNAGRNPRRTASTAASLMVGLALVTTALVVGESIKQSIRDTLASDVMADFVVTSDEDINPVFVEDLKASGSFDTVAAYRYDQMRLSNGDVTWLIGSDVEATGRLFDLGVSEGQLSNDASTIAVFVDEATDRGLKVGDTMPVTFPSGSEETLTVGAIFTKNSIIEERYLLPTEGWDDRFGGSELWWSAASIADGATVADARAELEGLTAPYPQLSFADEAEYQQQVESQIDAMLIVINAMLVLAIVIALIGIANTLALSVFERTREIGLLRAVGMTRRQTRRMIRWEAAQVALFGSILGIAVGLVFGWGVVTALPDSFVSTLAFPIPRIASLVLVCGIAGLAAAAFPARRASKLNVLDAISHA